MNDEKQVSANDFLVREAEKDQLKSQTSTIRSYS